MRSLRKDNHALLFQMLVGAGMSIIIFFAILNIGTYINSTVSDQALNSLTEIVTEKDGGRVSYNNTEFAHRTNLTLRNLSGDFDNVIDSLSIAAVVMAITLPLAAVVAIRKFF
jgi:hypothetical protein